MTPPTFRLKKSAMSLRQKKTMEAAKTRLMERLFINFWDERVNSASKLPQINRATPRLSTLPPRSTNITESKSIVTQ